MEKSVLRRDLALTRHEGARAHHSKYDLPRRERGKKKPHLLLAQTRLGSGALFP